jgi:large subunit ribosomal protein L23
MSAVRQYNSSGWRWCCWRQWCRRRAPFIADKHEQVIFKVLPDATKPEVKAAVEAMFKVQVESVQIANVGGKVKRFGRFTGRRRGWKKAYVCLKPGQEINFATET